MEKIGGTSPKLYNISAMRWNTLYLYINDCLKQTVNKNNTNNPTAGLTKCMAKENYMNES